jgi:hypothetical protein
VELGAGPPEPAGDVHELAQRHVVVQDLLQRPDQAARVPEASDGVATGLAIGAGGSARFAVDDPGDRRYDGNEVQKWDERSTCRLFTSS